jgi:vancomycin resistance protein YoaR
MTAAHVRRTAPVVHGRHVRLVAAAATLLAAALIVGVAFSGSPNTLPAGTRIAGIDVGGLTPRAARSMLAKRSAALARVPVTFVAGTHVFSIRPNELGVQDNWSAAVAAAAAKGQELGILRGFRRLELRLFPENVVPKARAYRPAVDYEVSLLAMKVDKPYRPARLVRHGLKVASLQGHPGELLDRQAASQIIVTALASLSRPSSPIELPTSIDLPSVTASQLAQAQAEAKVALSAPVTVTVAGKRFRLTPKQLAPMIEFPRDANGTLVLGGPAADAYFVRLGKTVGRPAHGATFATSGDRVQVVPAQPGRSIDVPRSAAALLAAAERSQDRVAKLAVTSVSVGRTTAAATAMGITGLVGSYETEYGGIANRIHNVELVAHLIDDKLIAPGATFSFNQATGARTAAKGFLEAPVIINGELSTGLGGGVCQVSTTVFNAAYEAGLPITARTNHALYISHYPLGRDATVDYPDVDLKFVNDTGHWLLLRTSVGPSSLVVSLYGTPQHRRVVSETAPLRVVSPAPVQRKLDRQLAPGTQEVEDPGSPALSTSVRRLVYSADGKLLSDATWYSNYRSSPEILLVGPKKPKPKTKSTAPATTPATSPAVMTGHAPAQ